MPLLIMAMVIAIFLHDNPTWQDQPLSLTEISDHPLVWVSILLGVKVLLLIIYGLLCRSGYKRLGRLTTSSDKALRWVDRGSVLYRYLIFILYAADLSLGGLYWVRSLVASDPTEHPILIDEIIFMTPTLLMLIGAWWCYYPIDRRLREMVFVRRIDEGRFVQAQWSRGQYILSQLRHQVALVLAPLILIMGWHELVRGYLLDANQMNTWKGDALTMGGALIVFLSAPLVIRHLWDTCPLPPGELRDRLTSLCRQYRIRVRELLLWRTFGGMINAAVMGVVGPLRYILLTDALLEQMPGSNVEAVMAHELAHVKKHHMFWLVVLAIGLLGGLEVAWLFTLSAAIDGIAAVFDLTAIPTWLDVTAQLAAVGMTVICWLLVFGWISRRFERQADSFAVQHIRRSLAAIDSSEQSIPARDPVLVDVASAQVMIKSLQRVADLNHIPATRRSWRHGSIKWRQDYLMALVGRPVDALPIDRQVRWIKTLGAVICAATFTLMWYLKK